MLTFTPRLADKLIKSGNVAMFVCLKFSQNGLKVPQEGPGFYGRVVARTRRGVEIQYLGTERIGLFDRDMLAIVEESH